METFIIAASAALLGFGLMIAGVSFGRRRQRERCGCDVDPLAAKGLTGGTGCACGGSCGCGN